MRLSPRNRGARPSPATVASISGDGQVEVAPVWVADPRGNRVVSVREGGEIAQTIPLPGRNAYACMLGGTDRRTLFICTATGSGPKREGKTDGKIEIIEVALPGAGLP
jgi:sugar lactone lactonase YvrE